MSRRNPKTLGEVFGAALRRAVRWLITLCLLAIAAVLALQLWFFAWIVYWKWENPETTAFMRRERARLEQPHDKNKVRRRSLRFQWVDYARISNHLKRAVVTAEDARFTAHEGVDWEALQRAYEHNQRRGRALRGGSTISQQLAKNLFLSGERSYVRKAQELVITWMIEWTWDKRRILEVYLNVAEWGEGVFGAQAAAQHYFGVSAKHLSASQSARLAAFLPNPKYYGRVRSGRYLDRRSAAIERRMRSAQIP